MNIHLILKIGFWHNWCGNLKKKKAKLMGATNGSKSCANMPPHNNIIMCSRFRVLNNEWDMTVTNVAYKVNPEASFK